MWLYGQCEQLIAALNIAPQIHPIPVAWMGRKRAVDFNSTTLETWKSMIPPANYVIRPGDREIVIRGRVKIDFGGLDDSTTVQKFNSAEYCYLFLDQAEETTLDDVATLRASLRRRVLGQPVPRKSLFTANPAPCWLRGDFIQGNHPTRRYVRALPSDNPYLPADYVRVLQDSYRHRPELLAAYIEGRWDVFESICQMIRESWVEEASRRLIPEVDTKRLIVCDPARFGDDETVIYGLENTRIKGQVIYGQKDLMYTTNELFRLHRQAGNCLVVIDPIGVGAGIADRLVEMGVDVLEVSASARAYNAARYANTRAEMWDMASQMFAAGDIMLEATQDGELERQLCSPSYEFQAGGKLLVEAKDKIKERLNRSPDRADAYVMGLYGLACLRKKMVANEQARYRTGRVAGAGVPVAQYSSAWFDAQETAANSGGSKYR